MIKPDESINDSSGFAVQDGINAGEICRIKKTKIDKKFHLLFEIAPNIIVVKSGVFMVKSGGECL